MNSSKSQQTNESHVCIFYYILLKVRRKLKEGKKIVFPICTELPVMKIYHNTLLYFYSYINCKSNSSLHEIFIFQQHNHYVNLCTNFRFSQHLHSPQKNASSNYQTE